MTHTSVPGCTCATTDVYRQLDRACPTHGDLADAARRGTRPMTLTLRPLTQRAARDWIIEHHRHSGAPRGDVIRVGVEVDGQLVGVGMAGRPVARMLDDGHTLEILRVCTLGHENACSRLYGALNRAAKALGWQRTITYTLDTEDGASVKAAGFIHDGWTDADPSWSRPSRERSEIKRPTCRKRRWRCDLCPQGTERGEL